MKTKLLAVIPLTLIVLSTSLFADSSHHQDEDKSSENTMQSGGMAMMDMKKMDEHMNEMKETMAQIHRTENREQRQKLMQQHMQKMHQGMKMMSGGMQEHHGEMMGAEKMKNCHGMMAQRINMMQGMMEQMMQHMSMGK